MSKLILFAGAMCLVSQIAVQNPGRLLSPELAGQLHGGDSGYSCNWAASGVTSNVCCSGGFQGSAPGGGSHYPVQETCSTGGRSGCPTAYMALGASCNGES